MPFIHELYYFFCMFEDYNSKDMENLDFVAIDLETATTERNSICEIGITVVKNAKIVESKSWLVKPEGNLYDNFNIYIHKITPNMTKDAPSFSCVWREVEPYVTNGIVVAHNSSFDMYALKDAFIANNMPFPTFKHFCSYRIAKYIINDCYSYSLPNICEVLAIPFGTHHRAEGDAIACANVFIECINRSEINSLEELQDKYNFKCGEFAITNFRPQLSKSTRSSSVKTKIIGNPSKIDEGSYFFNKVICFTGSFQHGSRIELLQKIADIGGIPVDSVTLATNILVVGQQDYRRVGDSRMSSKQKKAIELKDKGIDIEIMSETDFLSNL